METLCTVWEGKYVVFTQTGGWGGGWEGFSCDFWVYNETGAQQDGKRNRKGSWLLSLRISNVLLPRGWVTGYIWWQLVSPNDQLATSSSWWDLSPQVGSSRLWTWVPHRSVLPSRGQRKNAGLHRRPAGQLTGSEKDIHFQHGGSEEETGKR